MTEIERKKLSRQIAKEVAGKHPCNCNERRIAKAAALAAIEAMESRA